MIAILCVFLLQADPGKEIDDLVRSLGSDAPEERDRATARLKEIGRPALATLERIAKAGEGEIRARAREILVHLERMERVRSLRPSELRTTVDLHDVPLSEAIVKVLHPLGLTGLRAEGALKDRKVTLSLVEAPFWEAVVGLEKAAHARLLTTVGKAWEEGARARQECGNGVARVSLLGWGSSTRGVLKTYSIEPTVWLSPGVWVSSGRMEDVEVIGDDGKALECRCEDALIGGRRHGVFSTAGLGNVYVIPEEFKKRKKVTIRGAAVLRFPKDIQRYEPGKLLAKVEFDGGHVELTELKRRSSGSWSVAINAARTGNPFTLLMSVTDADDRWLGDLPAFVMEPNTTTVMGTSAVLRDGVPVHLVVIRALGEDEMRVPFSFELPVPE